MTFVHLHLGTYMLKCYINVLPDGVSYPFYTIYMIEMRNALCIVVTFNSIRRTQVRTFCLVTLVLVLLHYGLNNSII